MARPVPAGQVVPMKDGKTYTYIYIYTIIVLFRDRCMNVYD